MIRPRRTFVVVVAGFMSSFNRDQTQTVITKHRGGEGEKCYFDCFDITMKLTVNCELGIFDLFTSLRGHWASIASLVIQPDMLT